MKSNDLQFIYRNTYTDMNDRENSVKYYTDTATFVNLKQGATEMINFFIRKGTMTERFGFANDKITPIF